MTEPTPQSELPAGPPADTAGAAGPPGDAQAGPLVLHPVPPRFCGACGAAWVPTWTECPFCSRPVLQPLPDFVGRAWQPAADRPVWAVLSLFFAWLVINLLAAIAIKAGALSEAKAELVATGLACLVILLWLLRLHRQVAPGLRHVGKWWWYPLCVALGLATFAVATGAVRVLVHLLHIEELQYARPLLEAGYGWPMVLLMVCVQPAVFEELAFRGAILEVLRGLLGLRDAIVVTALLFMVLHLAVLSFPHLLLIGLVLGYVRTRSGSLYPCMVLHFTHNLLVVLAEMKGP